VPPSPVDALCDDFVAERAELDALLADLDAARWRAATPAAGWTILDQVTHLAWFDQAAATALTDPAGFRADLDHATSDIDGFVERVTIDHRHLDGEVARQWLRDAGDALVSAARAADTLVRVPWYGPDMSVASTVTARLMETWAHGQDVADTLEVLRVPTHRLRHVAFIGARAFANSFRAHGLPAPEVAVRVSITGPDGDIWEFGAPDADQQVLGPAIDFCLLVTQRRHRADTALVAVGEVADQWLDIAQAFAGPPGAGRQPRDRSAG
jgi:uncharacterized protein (TIGR03084 family)